MKDGLVERVARAVEVAKLSFEDEPFHTVSEATANLRFKGGVLEQMHRVYTRSRNGDSDMRTEWRPVPQVGE